MNDETLSPKDRQKIATLIQKHIFDLEKISKDLANDPLLDEWERIHSAFCKENDCD